MRPQKKFTRKNYPVKIFNPGVDMDITHLHIILGHTSRVSFCIGNIIDGLQMNAGWMCAEWQQLSVRKSP